MSNILRESPPLPPEDQRLVSLYAGLGRAPDDLPYSGDFPDFVARLRAAGDKRTEHDIIRRLFQLRKAARLPRTGRTSTAMGEIPDTDVELVEELLRRHVGATGSRDQLPYTDEFENLFNEYNNKSARRLDRHQLWRLIARVAK